MRQAGLAAASSGDEIWVAAGRYTNAVVMKAGVGLYGLSSAPLQTTRSVPVQTIALSLREVSGDGPALIVRQLSVRGL